VCPVAGARRHAPRGKQGPLKPPSWGLGAFCLTLIESWCYYTVVCLCMKAGGVPVYQRVKQQRMRTVGVSSTLRALQKGQLTEVVLARDTDRRVINPVLTLCRELAVKVSWVDSQMTLGRACGLTVRASAVGFLREE